MRFLISLVVFIFMSFLFSCEKKIEPFGTISETTTFYVKGSIQNESYRVEAGSNDYFMYSDYSNDSFNVLSFIGNIRKNCTSCKEGIQISIRNYKALIGNETYEIDSTFSANNSYLYYNHSKNDTIGYTVHFTSKSIGPDPKIQWWDFNDGNNFVLGIDPEKTYRWPGIYKLKHRISNSGNYNTLESYIEVDDKAINNKLDFDYSITNQRVCNFLLKGTDTLTHDIVWIFGDGITKQFNTVNPVYTYVSSGIYTVTLGILLKGTTDTIIAIRKKIVTSDFPDPNPLVANFDYQVNPVIDTIQLSRVIIEFTDASGTYTSQKANQDIAKDYFRVLSSKDFLLNDKGQKTRMIKVEFNCTVSNGLTSKDLKNMEANIAVAYP